MHKEMRSGIVKTMSSALLYGFTPSICALTYAMGNNHTSMTFFRNFLAVPALLVLAVWKKTDLRTDRKTFLNIFLVANLGTFITTLLLYSSYSYISVGMATTLHFLYPLLVVIFSFLFYGDKITPQKWCSIGLAGTGILCFLFNSRMGEAKGMLLAFASSITFALYMMLLDKLKLSELDGNMLMFYACSITAAEMYLMNIGTKELIFEQSPKVYGLMLLVALLVSVVANLFLKEGVRILGSTMASFVSLLEPISSIFFGVLLLNESVSVIQIGGCAAIILSIMNLIGFPQTRRVRA